jgi:TolB-like protein
MLSPLFIGQTPNSMSNIIRRSFVSPTTPIIAAMPVSARIAIILMLTGSIAGAAEPASKPAVLLLRFAQLNDAAGTEWIGRVVQESLLTDAAAIKTVRASSDQRAPTTDIATARQLAGDVHADWVVLGGYQTAGQDLKITGQVVNVASGQIVGTLRSTATLRDVISMEDTLARQLKRALSGTMRRSQPVRAKIALDTLGPVRIANYSVPFDPPNPEPHQNYRDRYIYGTQAFSPYCGYGCWFAPSCFVGRGFPYAAGTTPTSIFYGD